MAKRALSIGLSGLLLALSAGHASAQGTIRDEVRLSDEDAAAEVRTPEEVEAEQAAWDAKAAAKFRTAYRRVRSPRIAVFVNRELSAEVREVNPVAGVDQSFSLSRKEQGEAEVRWTGAARTSGWVGLAPDGSREMPEEDWLWELEAGFEAPFQAAGARLVDRATIVRLAAHRASRDGAEYAALSPKRVETGALLGHADVFVELLVTRSSRAASGFRLKATAKDVSTGRILATVLDDPDDASARPERLVVTDSGYELVEDDSDPVEGPARALAARLMEKLARVWS